MEFDYSYSLLSTAIITALVMLIFALALYLMEQVYLMWCLSQEEKLRKKRKRR